MITTPKKRKSSRQITLSESEEYQFLVVKALVDTSKGIPITLTRLCCILNFFRERGNCKEWLTTSTMLATLYFYEAILSETE